MLAVFTGLVLCATLYFTFDLVFHLVHKSSHIEGWMVWTWAFLWSLFYYLTR